MTGNAWFGEGLIYNKYSSYGTYIGKQGIAPDNLRLTEIRWEKTKSWNLGFNLNLLDDLFQFDLSVYKKYTSDLLMSNIRIPSSTGYSNIANGNVGKMENEGWELFVSTKPILNIGKFNVTLRANVAQNLNVVTEMDKNVLASMNGQFDKKNETFVKRVQIGHALGGIYGFRYKGCLCLRLRPQWLLPKRRKE